MVFQLLKPASQMALRNVYLEAITTRHLKCLRAWNALAVFSSQTRWMAGHSKWQNIRHTKGAKDAEKSKMSSLIVQKIRVAIREQGSPDPKYNSQLASVLEYGMSKNVPKSTMENAIKSFEKVRSEGKLVHIEIMGPFNSFLIVEAFTTRQRWVRDIIKSILKRYGGQVLNQGGAMHSFEYKGVILANHESNQLDLEAAEEVAIEVGAEEVFETQDDDGSTFIQFLCDKSDLQSVTNALGDHKYKVMDSRLSFIPTIFAPLSPEQGEEAKNCIQKIEDIEEVERVFDNIEVN